MGLPSAQADDDAARLADAGRFVVAQTAHGFSVGDFVELGSGGSWSTSLTKTGALRGMVAAVLDTNDFVLARAGVVTGLSGLTAGARLYSSAAGVVSAALSFWGVGHALSATAVLVEPWLPAVGTSVELWDEKTAGTSGGGVIAGGYRTRDLNDLGDDPFGLVSLSSNLVTPIEGRWKVEWSAPAFKVNGHWTRLYNTSSAETLKVGSTELAVSATAASQTKSFGVWAGLLGSDRVLRLEHQVDVDRATNGFGVSVAGEVCIYSQMTLTYLGPE